MKQLKRYNIYKATSEEMTSNETDMFLLGDSDRSICQKTLEGVHYTILPQLKERYRQPLRNG